MIKVSVIVPMYNGQAHLRQCMDSICNQTLREIEIICVDDGSTDSTPDIIREYMTVDPRVQLYQQQNQFAGAARNLGKSHATGEYLAFWDCDDYFELNALELMYAQAKKVDADVCVCGVNRWFEDTQMLSPNVSFYLKKKQIPDEVFNRHTNEKYIFSFTSSAPWNKIYRRSFVEAHALDFQAVRNGNDIYFTQCAFALADRITTIDVPLINYRLNQGTSLVDTTSKSPYSAFNAWVAVKERLEQSDALPKQSLDNRCLASIMYVLRNIKDGNVFGQALDYLQKDTLPRLQLTAHEDDGYYYSEKDRLFVSHLLNDSAAELQQYLLHLTYKQFMDMEAKYFRSRDAKQKADGKLKKLRTKQEKLEAKVEKLTAKLAKLEAQYAKACKARDKAQKKYEQILNSRDYRLGRALLAIPRKILHLFKK